jgi:hypothetical protein
VEIKNLTATNTTGFEKYQPLFNIVVSLYVISAMIISMAFGSKDWPHCVAQELVAYFLLDIVVLSAAFTIPARMAQHDAITTKVCSVTVDAYIIIIHLLSLSFFLVVFLVRLLCKIRRNSCGISVTSCGLL